MLPLFFSANALACAILIPLLQVTDPVYRTFPWVFGGAFLVTVIPPLGRRMTSGHPVWRALPVLLYLTVIALASAVSPQAKVHVASNPFHPVEFAGLAFVAQLVTHGGLRPRPRLSRQLLVALGCVAYGIADEIHQSFVPGRTATFVDVGLDTLGVLIGTGVYLALRPLSRLVTRP